MTFEIYDEAKKPEPVCRLKLTNCCGSGGIILQAVDENGVALAQGNILTIRSVDGRIIRHQALRIPGIKTDEFGRIQEKNNVDN